MARQGGRDPEALEALRELAAIAASYLPDVTDPSVADELRLMLARCEYHGVRLAGPDWRKRGVVHCRRRDGSVWCGAQVDEPAGDDDDVLCRACIQAIERDAAGRRVTL
jgi:hypothetical protein